MSTDLSKIVEWTKHGFKLNKIKYLFRLFIFFYYNVLLMQYYKLQNVTMYTVHHCKFFLLIFVSTVFCLFWGEIIIINNGVRP